MRRVLCASLLFIGLLSACRSSRSENPETTRNLQLTPFPEGTRLVTVGFWGNDDCSGKPAATNVFPVEYTDEQCYTWAGSSGENSATRFRCGPNSFTYTQWTSLTCSGGAKPDGQPKTVYTDQCVQDSPPTLSARILDFSGCSAP